MWVTLTCMGERRFDHNFGGIQAIKPQQLWD